MREFRKNQKLMFDGLDRTGVRFLYIRGDHIIWIFPWNRYKGADGKRRPWYSYVFDDTFESLSALDAEHDDYESVGQ